jgi:hypothetical protein
MSRCQELSFIVNCISKIGNTLYLYMQIVSASSSPEFPLFSSRVRPRPAMTFPKRPLKRSLIHEAQSE